MIPEKLVTLIGTSEMARLELTVPMVEIGAFGCDMPCTRIARNRKITRVAFFMLVVLSLFYLDYYQSINAKLRNVRLPEVIGDQTFYRVTSIFVPTSDFNLQNINPWKKNSGIKFEDVSTFGT